MCHLQTDSRISLILAAGPFNIILESLDVCSTDHLANLSPSKYQMMLGIRTVLTPIPSQDEYCGWSASAVNAPRFEDLLLKVASRRNLAVDFFFHALAASSSFLCQCRQVAQQLPE